MSQSDGFGRGFILGAILGGVVGGVVGVVVGSRSHGNSSQEGKSLFDGDGEAELAAQESIEIGRRSLEDKIAQLNIAIDDVRQQLDPVNSNNSEN